MRAATHRPRCTTSSHALNSRATNSSHSSTLPGRVQNSAEKPGLSSAQMAAGGTPRYPPSQRGPC